MRASSIWMRRDRGQSQIISYMDGSRVRCDVRRAGGKTNERGNLTHAKIKRTGSDRVICNDGRIPCSTERG